MNDVPMLLIIFWTVMCIVLGGMAMYFTADWLFGKDDLFDELQQRDIDRDLEG